MAKKKSEPKAEKPKTTEEKSEEVEEVKPEAEEPKTEEPKEESVPKFKNVGKDMKINLGTRDEPKWITVKEGETVTIPEKIALANNLEKVE